MAVDGKKIVLVVEDDADCVESMGDALDEFGCIVVGANNGAAALAYLEASDPPNLILLDLMMPSMDGWEFLKKFRENPKLRAIPVLIVSAETTLAATAEEMKVAGYLRKPLQLSALLDAIKQHARP